MILTEQLKLKKPEQDDFIDVDDINYNTDIIDDVLGDGNKHVVSQLLSKEGVHGLRVVKHSLQVFDKGKWKTVGGSGLNYIAPGNMRKFEASIFDRNKLRITFLEPTDTTIDDEVVAKTAGVMIRYSTETYPESIDQGTLAINNLELGKYETSGFELTGLKYNTTYYLTAFPYSDMELYNTSVTNQNRLMIKTQEIESVAPSSMRKFEVTPQGDGLLLTFEEPLDTIIDGEVASKVAGVMIRYSTEKYPENITEGTLAIDNKDLGKYKDEAFELKGLNHLNTYYISAFPYSDKNLYNTENNASNRVSAIPLGAEQITILSNKDCQISLSIGNDYQNIISISEQIPFNFTVNKGVVYKIEPFSISNRYKTPNKTVKVAVAGDNTEINLNYEKIKVLNDYSWAEIIQAHKQGKLQEIVNTSKEIEGRAYKKDTSYDQEWEVASISGSKAFFYLYKGSPLFINKIFVENIIYDDKSHAIQGAVVRWKDEAEVTFTEDSNSNLSKKITDYFKKLFPNEIQEYLTVYGIAQNSRAEDLYGCKQDDYLMTDYNDIRRGFIDFAWCITKLGQVTVHYHWYKGLNIGYGSGMSPDDFEDGKKGNPYVYLDGHTLLPFRLVLKR